MTGLRNRAESRGRGLATVGFGIGAAGTPAGRPPLNRVADASGVTCRQLRVHGDVVFLSTALADQVVALKHETELHWRARFFDVDLGTIEVLPLNDAFASETVIETVTAIHAKSATRDRAVVNA